MQGEKSNVKTVGGRLTVFFVIAAVVPLLILYLVGFNQFSAAAAETNMGDLVADLRKTAILLIFAVAAVSAAVGYTVSRKIFKPVSSIIEDTLRISHGDLSRGASLILEGNDEVSLLTRTFGEMVEAIRKIVFYAAKTADEVAHSTTQLSTNAEENSSGAEEIAATVQDMSAEADKQSSSIREVLELVNRMSEHSKQLADSAEEVSDSAGEVMKKAEEGNKSIATAVRQMHTINNVVANSAKAVFELGERSKEIEKINNTITGIAEQTNLLALNAAIEAARAGEQGRGFAVVADEVRKLAEQSSNAADEIAQLIKSIQSDTGEAVETIEAGTQEVKTGMKVMGEAGKAFQGVRRAVKHIFEQSEASAAAADGVEEGNKTIAKSMGAVVTFAEHIVANTQEIASVTEEQAASMEEVTSSTAVLAEMAGKLQKALGHFTVSNEKQLKKTVS